MSTISQQNQLRLGSLRRRWWGTTAVWLTVWVISWGWLAEQWPAHANRWALISGLTLVYTLSIVWRGLDENHRANDATLLPTLGWGNRLTLMRGLAISGVAGFLFSPWPMGPLGWLPVLLYTVADIADYFDGYLARKTNHATRLGERLDMEFDGLGMLIVSILAVWYGQLPTWYLLLGLARYLFVAGLWLRERLNLPIFPMHPSVHRRVFAGFQMGFMSAVLWPIIPSEGTTIAGTLFALPTALGFLRDWLVVSGRLDPTAYRYHQLQRWVVTATRVWLPPLLRLTLLLCMVLMLQTVGNWLKPAPWHALLIEWGVPIAGAVAILLGVIAVLATPLVVAGWMGRLLSLALVFPIGFDIASQGLTWPSGIALSCVTCLMLLGTGPFSWWPIEEKVVMERLG